jgi:type IV pilus assembly protein PilM
MAKKITSVVGIDIGSQAIKIAEVRLTGKTPTLTAIGQAMTPEGAVDHIGVHDPDSVGAVVKDLCAASGVSIGDAVVSVSGQGSVLVRTLPVATQSEAELKQHMDWEITRNIPFAESNVVSDYKAFPPDPADPQNMDVVMAISPQSAIDALLSMLKKAGKKPAAIDVQPLALARAAKVGYDVEWAGKSVCVIDMGHKVTAINIYRDGKLLMPRQVPIGGEMLTRAIADNLGVTMDEAQRMKENEAVVSENVVATSANPFDTAGATQAFAPYNPFADPGDAPASAPEADAEPVAPAAPAPVSAEPDRLAGAMAGVLDEFAAEVRRSIDYHRSKGGDVDMVALCGGGSKLRGLDRFIQGSTGLPVSRLDPFKGVTVSLKKPDSNGSGDHGEYALAVGNGLHVCF